MVGKTSKPRPFSVPLEEFDRNFDRIKWGTIDEDVDARMGEATEAPEPESADAPA